MKQFIQYLKEKEKILSELLNLPEPDFDDMWHTMTDEELIYMGEMEIALANK